MVVEIPTREERKCAELEIELLNQQKMEGRIDFDEWYKKIAEPIKCLLRASFEKMI